MSERHGLGLGWRLVLPRDGNVAIPNCAASLCRVDPLVVLAIGAICLKRPCGSEAVFKIGGVPTYTFVEPG